MVGGSAGCDGQRVGGAHAVAGPLRDRPDAGRGGPRNRSLADRDRRRRRRALRRARSRSARRDLRARSIPVRTNRRLLAESQLYRVRAYDPAVWAVVALALLVVAALGTL